MKALLVQEKNGENRMVLDDWPRPEPGPEELLVEVEAAALNRADLLQKRGAYPPPEGASPLLGLEMAGRVIEVGNRVKRFSTGDHVFGLLPGGGYAQFCTIDQDLAMPAPGTFEPAETAAIAEAFLTAWQGLAWLGELDEHETVLIHAGASGVGTAAIQLAKTCFNARVAVTAGTEEKLRLCRELGAEYTVNYRRQEFDTVLKESSGAGRPDLILDFVGASYWSRNLSLLALDGRLVLLGLLSGVTPDECNLAPILRKRLTIRGSTLRNRPLDYKRQLTSDFRDHCLQLFEEKKLIPVIDSVYDWSEVEKAHKKMQQNRTMGKVILTGMNVSPTM